MRVFKNLFGDGSKIHADEIALHATRNDVNPDTLEQGVTIGRHANNPTDAFYYIITIRYRDNKAQLALGYTDARVFYRSYYRDAVEDRWTAWREI